MSFVVHMFMYSTVLCYKHGVQCFICRVVYSVVDLAGMFGVINRDICARRLVCHIRIHTSRIFRRCQR